MITSCCNPTLWGDQLQIIGSTSHPRDSSAFPNVAYLGYITLVEVKAFLQRKEQRQH